MRAGAYVGWGIVIYAVMYLAWNGFVLYGFSGGILPRIAELAPLLIVCVIAGRSLRFHSWKDILPFSLSWAVVVALIDAAYTVPFAGLVAYGNWNLWVGYALVVLLPLLAPLTRVAADEPEPMT